MDPATVVVPLPTHWDILWWSREGGTQPLIRAYTEWPFPPTAIGDSEFGSSGVHHMVGALASSVSNGSNPLERFRVNIGTGMEPLQRILPHENPDHCNWAGFTTNNPAFQPHNFGSNQVSEFWLYCDMISMYIVQFYELFRLPLSDMRSN